MFFLLKSVNEHLLINYKFSSGSKNYSKKIDVNLKNRFKNAFKFLSIINKFILLLRKGKYPYEFMNDWEKFSESSLSEKEEVYSNLNME